MKVLSNPFLAASGKIPEIAVVSMSRGLQEIWYWGARPGTWKNMTEEIRLDERFQMKLQLDQGSIHLRGCRRVLELREANNAVHKSDWVHPVRQAVMLVVQDV